MDKVMIPLDLFYKMIEAIDDGDLRQQAYDAQVNFCATDLDWIKEALKDDAARFPQMADYLAKTAKNMLAIGTFGSKSKNISLFGPQ